MFTVWKLELRLKAIVSQSRSRRTRNRGKLWAKRKESNMLGQNKNKPRSKCCSAGLRRHSLQTWDLRIQRWRMILACSWKWLSRNIVFICFLLCHYFFPLTPGTSRDEALSASLSKGWLNHFRRDFAFSLDEFHWSSSFSALALFCFLSKDFSLLWSVLCWRKDLVSKAWPQFSVNKKC